MSKSACWACKRHVSILFMPFLSHVNIETCWCCQGFSTICHCLFKSLLYSVQYVRVFYLFSLMIICSPLSSAFSPPSPLRVDILVFHKLTCFSHHPILSLRCPYYSDRLGLSSILKCKRQARIQVLCVFFLSCLLFIWTLLLTAGAIERTDFLFLPLIPAFFGVVFIASPIPLKSINSSDGKLHFPWYNLLCYSPSAVYHSTSMYKLCLSSLDQ